MNLRWMISRTVRDAGHMLKYVHKVLSAQRDLLSANTIQRVEKALGELQAALASNAETAVLKTKMKGLETTANDWLKPYPNAGFRENVEVLLVAIAVAMAIRTFFLQPFKIPTGSMQPTLYGITHENLIDQPDARIPNRISRFFQFWIKGLSYEYEVAKADGPLRIELPKHFLLFNLKQRYWVGDKDATIWFPDDKLFERAGLRNEMVFKSGDTIMKIKVISGDHLFVDRFSYNFRRPKRGEIIVFQTAGITHQAVPQDQFYIKRLVGLGGEHVRIGPDNHLIIDGKRLDSSTPRFGKVYSFDQGPSPYIGHSHAGRLTDENQEIVVRPQHYLVMGDNTDNSLDSRYFGDFSREYVIGKSFFVYWPFSSRFSWGYK
jgi:signal peptidase I